MKRRADRLDPLVTVLPDRVACIIHSRLDSSTTPYVISTITSHISPTLPTHNPVQQVMGSAFARDTAA